MKYAITASAGYAAKPLQSKKYGEPLGTNYVQASYKIHDAIHFNLQIKLL